MKTLCTNCDQRLDIPEELAGRTVECPVCNTSLVVPEMPATQSLISQVQATESRADTPQKKVPRAKPSMRSYDATPKKSKLPIGTFLIAAFLGLVMVAVLVARFGEGFSRSSPILNKVLDVGYLAGPSAAEKASIRNQISSINSSLRLDEIGADTVQQQIVLRQTATVEMAGLLARALGATQSDVALISSSMRLDDINNETVHQQNALRSSYLVKMLGLASEAAGADSSQTGRIESKMRLDEISANTVFQQIAIRQTAVVEMSGVLSLSMGASSSSVNSKLSSMNLDDISNKTVNQQIALRMRYFASMLYLGAEASGVNGTAIHRVQSDINLREISADTVYQQMAIRVSGGKDALELIVRSIVE